MYNSTLIYFFGKCLPNTNTKCIPQFSMYVELFFTLCMCISTIKCLWKLEIDKGGIEKK